MAGSIERRTPGAGANHCQGTGWNEGAATVGNGGSTGTHNDRSAAIGDHIAIHAGAVVGAILNDSGHVEGRARHGSEDNPAVELDGSRKSAGAGGRAVTD